LYQVFVPDAGDAGEGVGGAGKEVEFPGVAESFKGLVKWWCQIGLFGCKRGALVVLKWQKVVVVGGKLWNWWGNFRTVWLDFYECMYTLW
jgi:hypothetical protein